MPTEKRHKELNVVSRSFEEKQRIRRDVMERYGAPVIKLLRVLVEVEEVIDGSGGGNALNPSGASSGISVV